MQTLEPLRACAGAWSGTSRLILPPDPAREEPSTVVVTPVLRGSCVRLDYTWSFEGAPQEGTLLIGLEAERGRLTAVWGDTWHMGDKLMVCNGQAEEGPALNLLGSYAVEGHPDWGWRIGLLAGDDGSLQLQMYNVSPEGEEFLGVDAVYSRAV